MEKVRVCTHHFQMMPNWQARGKEKEGNQLILTVARLPCRGTWRGWKSGLPVSKLMKFTQTDTKSFCWVGRNSLAMSQAGAWLAGQQLCWEEPGVLWHQRPEGSWAVTRKPARRLNRSGYPLSSQNFRLHLKFCAQVLGTPVNNDVNRLGECSGRLSGEAEEDGIV